MGRGRWTGGTVGRAFGAFLRRFPRGPLLLAALAASCGGYPTDPGEMITAPDPARDGVGGEDGRRGAAWVEVTAQARVTERLLVQVVFPARADGTLDREGAPHPAVVFVQGAGVGLDRYRWLAKHLATRGYVVLLPDHPFDLAALDPDNAALALRAVRNAAGAPGTLSGAVSPSAPAAVMGHGLGGTVAARQWLAHGEFNALGLLAAYPAEGDDVGGRAGAGSLAITGTADLLSSPPRVREGFEALRAPRYFAAVEGMNHYAWTDAPEDDERASDGPRPRDLAATRRNALAVLDAWLDATARRDERASRALDMNAFTGVAIER